MSLLKNLESLKTYHNRFCGKHSSGVDTNLSNFLVLVKENGHFERVNT